MASRPGRRNAPEITIVSGLVYVGLAHGLHWNEWYALVLALASMFLAGIWGAMIRDLFRPCPPELAGQVITWRLEGWQQASVHPLACDRKDPHVHMRHPETRRTAILAEQGKVPVLEEP